MSNIVILFITVNANYPDITRLTVLLVSLILYQCLVSFLIKNIILNLDISIMSHR